MSERVVSAAKLVTVLARKFRNKGMLHYDDLMAVIADVPTVNTVEVVRCKDCKHWKKCESSLIGETMCCTGQGSANILKAPSDFCSYGVTFETDNNVASKADLIRAMNDEELAHLLYTINDYSEGYCKNLLECEALLGTEEGIPDEKCMQCVMAWLRQPAEGDSNG